MTQAQKILTRFPKRTQGRKLLRTSSLVFGNLRQSSGIVGSLWKSSDEIIRNCLKMAETPCYTKQNNIGLFGAVFAPFRKKLTVSQNFLLLVLKCVKFNCFMFTAKKRKCLIVIEELPFRHSNPLSWVSESFKQDIGQFHSPRG